MSNKESALPCSDSQGGCQTRGEGHHVILNCNVYRPEPGYQRNFQLRTDGGPQVFLGHPLPQQVAAALQRSKEVLDEFVKRVESKRPRP